MNSNQRIVIFNRGALPPSDGWIHIVPKGELPNHEAGIVQVLDDLALDSILAGIEQDKIRLGEKWPGIYAGREHFIYDSAQDSAALGWFKQFAKRADGIWANADGLTSLGAEAVKNRLYKFTSFVADPKNLVAVPRESTAHSLPSYRVMKIETVGFTNYANGKELLTPITNRTAGKMPALPVDGSGADCNSKLSGGDKLSPPREFQRAGSETGAPNIFPGAQAPADTKHQTGDGHQPPPPNKDKGPNMKSVCTLLGLSAEADEPSVHAAVTKLLNRGDIAPDALAALRAEHQSLGDQIQLLVNEQAEALLDGCGVKEERVRNRLKDGMKLLKNRSERLSFLADFGYAPGKSAALSRDAATIRVLNRGTGATQEAIAISAATSGSHGEQAVAIKILNRTSELQGKGLRYDPAWNQARREVLGRN